MDLLDAEATADFLAAMRDLTDTFHQDPVTLIRAIADCPLLAGLKAAGDGKGEEHGELRHRDTGEEIAERYTVTFNRAYLAEQGLVDNDDQLLISVDDQLLIAGKRFAIAAVADRARFRGFAILVVLQAVR